MSKKPAVSVVCPAPPAIPEASDATAPITEPTVLEPGVHIRATAAMPHLVQIELPMVAEPKPGYSSRHVDLQLDADQAITLRRVFEGIDAAGSRLASGKRITTNADVVRFLLEQIKANSGSFTLVCNASPNYGPRTLMRTESPRSHFAATAATECGPTWR